MSKHILCFSDYIVGDEGPNSNQILKMSLVIQSFCNLTPYISKEIYQIAKTRKMYTFPIAGPF